MEEILQKLNEQDEKLGEIAKTVKKIKLFFIIMFGLSIVTFVLPLLSLIFVIPWFLKTMGSTYQGLL